MRKDLFKYKMTLIETVDGYLCMGNDYRGTVDQIEDYLKVIDFLKTDQDAYDEEERMIRATTVYYRDIVKMKDDTLLNMFDL